MKKICLNGRITRKFDKNWKMFLGLLNNYRFDNILGDFYELRPSLGVNFNLPITSNFSIGQRGMVESRNFFISEHDHYFRTRLRTELFYTFKNSSWEIFTGFEWYFLRDPNANERFSNSREFNLGLRKKTKNNHTLGISYLREIFLARSNNFGTKANTFLLYYEF